MKKRQLIEGYLTRSRRSGIHLPLFRSQWIRRYFVLSLTPSGPIVEEYHCDKKEAVRKSYDLSKCEQVDSYLQLADTACGYPRFSLVSQWIFSLHLKIDGRMREIFFVAQSEREMNAWVKEMCRICGLAQSMDQHPGGPNIRIPASGGEEILSSFGLSSSGRSSESLIDTPTEVTSDGNQRDHDHHQPRNTRYASTRTIKVKNGTNPRMAPAEKKISLPSGEHIARASSSASGCSSMTSSHHTTEDETSSVHSSHSINTGPPLPPKPIRNRFTHQSSTTSSGILYNSRSRGMNLSQTIPAPSCTLVEVENESSGETIKMHTFSTKASPPTHSYAIPHGYLVLPSASGSKTSSVSSSMAIGPSQGPPVDRSKKPAKLRLEQEDRDDHRRSNTLTRTSRVPQYTRPKNRQMFDAPRSAGPITHTAHLDYFEPKLFEHLDRTVSDRGSTPSDFDYIKIDAAKTQAIKIAASMK